VDSLGIAGYEIKGTPETPMKVTFTKNRMITRPAYVINYWGTVSFGKGSFNINRSTTMSLSNQDLEATL
jgi:hypothetical protein